MLGSIWLYQRMFILKEKALKITGCLSCDELKGSNGWFDCWKKNTTMSGRNGYVSGATVDSWKERFPDILQGYCAKNT